MMLPGVDAAVAAGRGLGQASRGGGAQALEPDVLPDELLLKDYRPKSVYRIPVSNITRAKHPIIDVHHPSRPKTAEQVAKQVRMMDKVNVERSIAFSGIGEQFLTKYASRVCYGTDMPYTPEMLSTTFRIMESADEHFYAQDVYFNFNYHWPLHGFALPDGVLKKVYLETAVAAIRQAQENATG